MTSCFSLEVRNESDAFFQVSILLMAFHKSCVKSNRLIVYHNMCDRQLICYLFNIFKI